jgi:hypothetical protein
VTAGVEDWSILGLHVTASRAEKNSTARDGYIKCSVGGLTIPDASEERHHFRWTEAPLSIGSVVTIRVVDVPQPDAPKKRYRSDGKVQESPFTAEEEEEMRYRDYLSLKKEFEPGGE